MQEPEIRPLKRAPTISVERTQHDVPRSRFPPPLQMALLLLIGIAGAVAHQLYYQSLDGRKITTVGVSQTWNLRIGSVLAFSVKTSWTMAVLVAHTQQVWMTMDRKPLSLDTVDAMFGAVTDFTRFVHWKMLSRAKVATLLAVVAWCLPLSAILTPSTLTVEAILQTQSESIQVPMVDFNNATRFATYTPCDAYDCQVLTENPDDPAVLFRSPNAQTVITSVASSSTGRTQDMPAPYPNATYSLSFSAPYTKCGAANQSTIDAIATIDTQSAPTADAYPLTSKPNVYYYAFVPGIGFRGGLQDAVLTNLPTTPGQLGYGTIPVAPEIWIKAGIYGEENHYVCTLYNATYSTNFIFSGGVQSAQTSLELHDPMPWVVALAANESEGLSLAPIAYQAIWFSYIQQLVGRFDNTSSNPQFFQTPVIGSRDFQPYFAESASSPLQPFATDRTIPEVIEELSKNITLSFFASRAHRSPNAVSTSAMITTSTMIYQYNQVALLVSYGFALLVTIASILIGIVAYQRNGGERGLAYSAIVHAARDSEKEKSRESESDDSAAATPTIDLEQGGKELFVHERSLASR